MGGPSVGGLLVAGADRARTPSSWTRCPSSARPSSSAGSGRLSRRRPTAATGSPRACGSSASSPIVRASLTGVAVVNFFNLHVQRAVHALRGARPGRAARACSALVIGAGARRRDARLRAVQAADRPARRRARLRGGLPGVHRAARAGAARLPACTAPRCCVMLFAAEFASGFGVMVLDISIAAIFGVVIPPACGPGCPARSRRSTTAPGRPARCSAGCSAACSGCGQRCGSPWPAAVAGSLLLLPSPLPGFRMPG